MDAGAVFGAHPRPGVALSRNAGTRGARGRLRVKRSPHPFLRRLLAAGAAPIQASRRLTRSGEMLAPLLRGIDELRFPLVEAIEPLLREIDLSGIGRRATAATERRRERVAVPPRRNTHRAGRGNVGTAETKRELPRATESPASTLHAGDVAAILRRYEHGVIESRGNSLAGGERADIAARAPEPPGEPAAPLAASVYGEIRRNQPDEQTRARKLSASLARPKHPAAKPGPDGSGGTRSAA